MGKSSRIVVLSVFSVLTLCVFLALLAVRPGIQNDILAQARARQAQSLVDVNEPLETDPQTVSEAEAFADEVRQILLSDESFRSDVANSVASDPAFIESVSSQIRADVEEYVSLNPYLHRYALTLKNMFLLLLMHILRKTGKHSSQLLMRRS